MYDRKLRVFVSSRMQELAAERRVIKAALSAISVDAWVFEDDAGGRTQSIQQTYLRELEDADLYLGLFWKGYGEYTVDEFEHAHSFEKECLVYEKRTEIAQRDPQLDVFLKKISDVKKGLTVGWFDTIEELAEQVKNDVLRWQTDLTRQALAQRVRAERERQAGIRAQEQAAPRQRVVNLAPQGIAEQFKDRTTPLETILNTLLAEHLSIRVVTVLGQGGVGKTALACRVMWELEHNQTVNGLVYLSTRTTTITLERLYHDCARMLGGDVEQKLINIWKKEDSNPASKIQALLEAFGNQRYVLLLDNVESVMDERGLLAEPDLQQFLNSFLSQHHGARLLVTTREPLNPSIENRKYQKLVPLEKGLPLEFAIELLRDRDEDGALGLRGAKESLLKEAAEKTLGYPVALEAIIGFLSEGNSELTLTALLADKAVFNENVIENLVRAALSRLDERGHRVMQALAVFGRPVRDVAVYYLLEPYVESASLQETLHRLTRGLYINKNRDTGELILHPFYREFSYSQIPIDGNGTYTRAELESRAATYYSQLRAPRESKKSIRDLDPELFEFDHSLRAGQYDRAAQVLSTVDRDFLIWKGSARRVKALRAMLDGKIENRQLQLQHHESLGQISMILGRHEEGLDHFIHMKQIAVELGDLTAVARALRHLGETSRLLGRHDDAIAYLREAVTFFRQQNDLGELRVCLFYLGLAYCYGGYAQEAIACGEEVLQIAAQGQDVGATAHAHDVLSLANLVLEQWDRAAEHARSALDAYSAIGSNDVCYVENVQGMALFRGGRHDDGLRALDQALARAQESDLPRAAGLVLFNQARAFRALKQPETALDSARAALAALIEGRFHAAAAAQPLVEALMAAARDDRASEMGRLLDCARGSLGNPDLQPPSDLVAEVEAGARELGLETLANEAAQMARTIGSRQLKQSRTAS